MIGFLPLPPNEVYYGHEYYRGAYAGSDDAGTCTGEGTAWIQPCAVRKPNGNVNQADGDIAEVAAARIRVFYGKEGKTEQERKITGGKEDGFRFCPVFPFAVLGSGKKQGRGDGGKNRQYISGLAQKQGQSRKRGGIFFRKQGCLEHDDPCVVVSIPA